MEAFHFIKALVSRAGEKGEGVFASGKVILGAKADALILMAKEACESLCIK